MSIISILVGIFLFGLASNALFALMQKERHISWSPWLLGSVTVVNCLALFLFNAARCLSFEITNIGTNSIAGNYLILAVATLICVLVAMALKKQKHREDQVNSTLIVLCLFVCISFFAEYFVFNFRHYELCFGGYQEKAFTIEDAVITGFSLEESVLVLPENTAADIEFSNIDAEVRNLTIEVTSLSSERIQITVLPTDESNIRYFETPRRQLYQDEPNSWHIPLYLNGQSKSIKLHFPSQGAFRISLAGITINAPRPLQFHYGRCLILFFLLIFFYLVRPSSKLYAIKINFRSQKQVLACLLILILQFGFLFFTARTSVEPEIPQSVGVERPQKDYYARLAESFLSGKVSIDETPPEELSTLENPYDIGQRTQPYLWDMTYYKGQYFFYYGPVPAVILYVPYLALTGNTLPCYIAVFILAVCATIGLFCLLRTLVERFFKNTPFFIFIASFVLAANSTLIPDLLRRPMFYEVMEMGGLAFAIAGTTFWLNAVFRKERAHVGLWEKPRLNRLYLVLGSTCMALAVGCRPSLIVASLLAFPIFGNHFYEQFGVREFFASKGKLTKLRFGGRNFVDIVLALTPYMIIGAGLMYYNYIRYDSVFEFGVKYQLTGLQTAEFKIIHWMKLLEGTLTYLFHPVDFGLAFPYFAQTPAFNFTHMGKAYVALIRGAFNNLILLLVLLAPKLKSMLAECRDRATNRSLVSLVRTLLLVGLLAIALVVLKGGVMTRYMVDSLWMWIVAALVILYALYEYAQGSKLLYFVKHYFVLCLVTGLVINIAISLVGEQNLFQKYYPSMFYSLERMFSFWL